MNRQRIRRYPGLHYFTTEQKAQFFGREEEEAALLALVLTEKIVALFGKSGYGKSSLLRAGLIPQLPSDWLPIVVQLGAYQAGQSATPLARTLAQLDAALPEDTPETAFLEQISAADTLWRRFRRKQSSEKRTFLLLFDQFEEFQTYPADQRAEFKKQLAELLYTRIPQAVRDAADDLPDAQQAILARPNEVKALFALREDRLSVLDGLADKLPAILHKRYHLKGLDDAHAQEAILRPAALPQDDRYESPAFRYTEGALSAIKRGLKKDERDTTIESFLLQICCEEIERGVIERAAAGAHAIEVAERDLPEFEALFEQYYRNKIAALPDDTQRAAARRMMEDHLVKTDPGSGIAYRINADGRALCALPGVDEALLKRLTDVFLLRSEPNTTGGFSYEVSHDRLVEGILAMKQEYEAEEAEKRREQERIEAERRAREAEEKAAEERSRAEAAERLQKEAENQRAIAQKSEARAQARTRLALLVSLVAVALAVFAGWSYNQAQTKTKETAAALEKVEQEKAATEAQRGIAEAKTREAESNLQLADDNLKKAQAEETRAKAALAQVEKEKAATEEQRQAAQKNYELAQEKTLEAEKNAEEARAALAQVEKEKAATEEQRQAAQKNYELAQEKTLEAENNAAEARAAYEKQQAALEDVVLLILQNADRDILNLRYEDALEKIKGAASLEALKPAVANHYLEIAFWHGETGNLARAVQLLDTIASYTQNDAVAAGIRSLPPDTAATRNRLRDAMKMVDAEHFDSLYTKKYYPDMVTIPGGKFMMGCDKAKDPDCGHDETPHEQAVRSFQIARTETTVWQFALYCAAENRDISEFVESSWSDPGDNPVVNVSWYAAVEYANWVGRQKGEKESIYKNADGAYSMNMQTGYRLPTEAEWEYAAGGGRNRTKYGGTNEAADLQDYAWYYENSGSRTRSVGAKKANALGLYDMSGNVWEWCWDWYGEYPAAAQNDPKGPDEGAYRVYRGGSWPDYARHCRVSYRDYGAPGGRRTGLGFRLAASPSR